MSQFVKDTVLGQIRGENDGGDRTWGRVQLPAYPSGTKRMKLAYKAWIEDSSLVLPTPAGNWLAVIESGLAWNPLMFFGLSLDDTVYNLATPSGSSINQNFGDFVGFSHRSPAYYGPNSLITYPDTTCIQHGNATDALSASRHILLPAGQVGTSYTRQSSQLCIGNSLTTNPHAQTGFSDPSIGTDADTFLCTLPIGSEDGLVFSGLIEVWADALDKTMRVRFAHSYAGLTGEDMLDTASSPATLSLTGTLVSLLNRTHVIHGDVTSNWRPSFGEVVLPRWFKFCFPRKTGKLIIDEYVVSYEGA